VVCLSGSPGALRAARQTFPDLPTAIQKILIGGVIRCAVTATGSNYLREPMLELWMFVLAIAVLLVVLAAMVL
jgi:hypothetical protein